MVSVRFQHGLNEEENQLDSGMIIYEPSNLVPPRRLLGESFVALEQARKGEGIDGTHTLGIII